MPAPTSALDADLLIPTKLNQPRIHQTVLERPHLWQQLQAGLESGMILACAPAGYGKTTLISTWLQQGQYTVAWLSLDEADSELSTFLDYLAAMLQTVDPAAGTRLSTLQGDADALSIRYIVQLLVNDLLELPQATILILEDYHLIAADSPVHQFVSMVLEYLPPHVHVVITTRFDPPLPLARWRASGSIFEVRANHLAWSLDELKAYVDHVLQVQISAKHLDTLHKRTEGWPAGIQLALFALQQQTERDEFMTAFAKSNRFVMEYLTDEVLSRLPTTTHEFLLKVSIFDRCCPSLCAATTGMSEDACRSILTWMVSRNMFTTAMDAQNNWFRFHAAFQELLHTRLILQMSHEEVVGLHRRAVAWLSQHGQVEAAVTHALAVDDLEIAAELVEQNTASLLNRERFTALARLLHMLPRALIHARPALLLTEICIIQAQNSLSEIYELLQKAKRLLRHADAVRNGSGWRALWGEWSLFMASHYYWCGEGERSVSFAAQALEQLSPADAFLRGLAYFYLYAAHQTNGNLPMAVQQLQALLADPQLEEVAVRSRLWLALCSNYRWAGEWYQLMTATHHMLQDAQANDQPANVGWSHYLLGLVHYEWNQLDAASEHFSSVIAQEQRVRLDTRVSCYLGLALVHQARGQTEQANACVNALLDMLLQAGNTALLLNVEAFRVRLALRQDELELANSWARTAHHTISHIPKSFIEARPLTYVRVLLSQNTLSSLQRALDFLAAYLETAEKFHNHWRSIEILALQALTLAALEQIEEAMAALERSVMLAERGGFVRMFVDLGASMARLLGVLHTRATLPESLHAYMQTVIEAFPAADSHAIAHGSRSETQAVLVEPLTDREHQVLELLEQRLMAKEIAQELIISLGTVKKHTSNIYQKLNVKGRRQAVERARALGILPISPG